MQLTLQQQRQLLFTPCRDQAHFKAWVRQFLGLELPDCVVSEESTSNPLDAAWTFYDKMLKNDLVGFSQVMTYAGRGGFKTLSAAVLETMVLLHTRRNVGHMAAIDAQSQKSASYVKSFFSRVTLRDFVVGDNARGVRVVRYTHRQNGTILTEGEFQSLDIMARQDYDRCDNYLKIVICTLAGSQSEHVEFFVIDEVDVVPKQNIRAYNLAKNIPDPREGMLPFTLLTSTRKSRIGLVQREIDKSPETGLKVLHWNIIDVTQRCQPDRHRPELPRQTYYVNDDEVRHVTAEEFGVMNPGQQKKWYPVEGFAGCRGCRLFAGCKGRLATHQKSNSPMLKPVEFGIEKFQSAPTPEDIITEYLCRKPNASGLIYPRVNREVHWRTAAQLAEMVTGDPRPATFSKSDLIALLKSKAATWYAGMDFGFTHNFAVVTLATYGQWILVLDCYAQAGLELDDKVANSEYLKTVYGNPAIYPDPAYPADIKTFRRKGFRMKEWDKNAGSVKAGIEIVRALLWSARGTTRLFFLKDDPGVELLLKHVESYKFKVDAAGEVTDVPDETDDDEPDALRYVVMNVAGSQGALKEGGPAAIKVEAAQAALQPLVAQPGRQQDWMKGVIREATGGAAPSDSTSGGGKAQVKKGRFIYDQ